MGRELGLWTSVSIGIGGMIGAGIFSILGIAASIAGDAVYISFIVAGSIALLSAYSYAKLGVRYPSAGGPVEYLVRGFGDCVISGGFSILLWVGYVIALALYAEAFAAYARALLSPSINLPGFSQNIIATFIILVFTAVNYVGARAVGESEIVIVTAKVAILVGFAVLGFFFVKPAYLSVSSWPGPSNIAYAAVVLFLAYEGFGLITNAAEDMKDPGKTLPRAIYLSVLITMSIYVLVSLAVVGNLTVQEIVRARDYALAEAARPFLGSMGFTFMAAAALLSTSSAINATLYGGANVSYIMAKEGELPEVFERKVWGRSEEGLFITAFLVIALSNLFDLSEVSMMGSAAFLLIYGAVNIAHLRIYRETNSNRYVLIVAILSNIVALAILLDYMYSTTYKALLAFLAVTASAFITEKLYRYITKRELKTRNIKQRNHSNTGCPQGTYPRLNQKDQATRNLNTRIKQE